jgi:hypothetical protein
MHYLHYNFFFQTKYFLIKIFRDHEGYIHKGLIIKETINNLLCMCFY